jgi:cytochrome c biogenesis protein CcmG/thiol:disulfide interchange protein DsbE
MNNKPVNLADYKGKVVLLNFWATWCGPCKQEIPAFVELYDQYKDKGFVVLGVSIDDSPEQLRAFTHEWRMQYPVLQMQSDIESAYGPFFGVPTSFFLARDGSICTKHLGPATKEQFEREIKALL